MIILTIRTDKSEAEVGTFRDHERLAYDIWVAHRELSATIHDRINNILSLQQIELKDVGGIVAYTGPGSFTGLRIGISVANALAYSLDIPVVGVNGEDWIKQGIQNILSAPQLLAPRVIPEYGYPVHTTKQKK
jgi:tRNA threonylcarbamoyladenosine biosynthesis protein TsaB